MLLFVLRLCDALSQTQWGRGGADGVAVWRERASEGHREGCGWLMWKEQGDRQGLVRSLDMLTRWKRGHWWLATEATDERLSRRGVQVVRVEVVPRIQTSCSWDPIHGLLCSELC